MIENENFYFRKGEPQKSCLLALRSIILNAETNITETKKYGMPCFCYKNKMFCYLWINKKTLEPYILFIEGKHLKHPKLETGSKKRMKVLNINSKKNIPIKTLELLLKKAIELY